MLSFSLIIPTYNRPRQLAACLQSVAQLRLPTDRFEIIVVNDGGDAAQIAGLCEQQGVLLCSQPNAGPAAARNSGATQARGELLVFLDDDCQPHSEWLAALAAQLERTPDKLVGGRTLNALPHNPYATASQRLIDYLYAYYNQAEGGPRFFTSNNFALARRHFVAAGGFDISFPLAAGEDREFCDRWRHLGWEMAYVPEAVLYHAHELTLRTFWRQHFGYGRGAYHFHQQRRQRQEKVKIEPASFYKELLLYAFRNQSDGRRLQLTCLLVLTQVANAAGFFYERWERWERWRPK